MVTWGALFDRAAEHEATAADVRAALSDRRADGEAADGEGETDADGDTAGDGGTDQRGDDVRS
jgi:hypothetical protein